MSQTLQSRAAGLSVVDKLRMLLDITKTISRSLDLQEVLNLVMDTLDSLIPYDAAGIYLVKCSRPLAEWEGGLDETCVFHTEAVRGYDIADMQELRLKMGEGLIGHVAVSGKPFISPDVRDEPRYVNARARTKSEMVAPIVSNEEVIGVFDLAGDVLGADGFQQFGLRVWRLRAGIDPGFESVDDQDHRAEDAHRASPEHDCVLSRAEPAGGVPRVDPGQASLHAPDLGQPFFSDGERLNEDCHVA